MDPTELSEIVSEPGKVVLLYKNFKFYKKDILKSGEVALYRTKMYLLLAMKS